MIVFTQRNMGAFQFRLCLPKQTCDVLHRLTRTVRLARTSDIPFSARVLSSPPSISTMPPVAARP